MKIAVIGASGLVGGAITREALRRGHDVTALVRDPARLAEDLTASAVATADVRDPVDLARAVSGHDAVIASVKGRGDHEARVTAEAARSLVTALPAAGVRRLVFIGGAGSLLAAPGTRYLDLPQFPAPARAQSLVQAEALEILQATGAALDWSYLSPPPVRLVDGPGTSHYRVAAGDTPVMTGDGQTRFAVADLASAAVDAVADATFLRQRFTVGYPE